MIVLPGSLPDVLAGFVLLARPLAHKYLHPHLYEDRLQLELACGSQLHVERDMAVPVRYSFDRQRGVDYTRFDGTIQEPWVEYSRGQALVVLEGGRRYADNEVVTAIKRGDVTIGRMLQDGKLYESLVLTVERLAKAME